MFLRLTHWPKKVMSEGKRTTGGRGRQAAFSSAVKANTCFSYLRKTLIIHIRDHTNHWCNPEFSINTCLLQIHFFTHVLLSSMAAPECVWVMTYQFLRGCLWFLYFSNELNTVYSFMKMIFRKHLLQFLLLKKSTRRLSATHAAMKHPLQKRLKWQYCHMH